MMERDDEEFEKLLGEIPQATSAPQPQAIEDEIIPVNRHHPHPLVHPHPHPNAYVDMVESSELYQDLYRVGKQQQQQVQVPVRSPLLLFETQPNPPPNAHAHALPTSHPSSSPSPQHNIGKTAYYEQPISTEQSLLPPLFANLTLNNNRPNGHYNGASVRSSSFSPLPQSIENTFFFGSPGSLDRLNPPPLFYPLQMGGAEEISASPSPPSSSPFSSSSSSSSSSASSSSSSSSASSSASSSVKYRQMMQQQLFERHRQFQEHQALFHASFNTQTGGGGGGVGGGGPSSLPSSLPAPFTRQELYSSLLHMIPPNRRFPLVVDPPPTSPTPPYSPTNPNLHYSFFEAQAHAQSLKPSLIGSSMMYSDGTNNNNNHNPHHTRVPLVANGHLSNNNKHAYSNGTHSPVSIHHLDRKAAINPYPTKSVNSTSALTQKHLPSASLQSKYTTLEELEGCIYYIAKDQHGCRFLQRKFEEGLAEDVQKIFVEIIDHICELMTDPFGNYLIQKLLEVCIESQRMEILCRVTGNGQLVTIALNTHGTRAVQKLIETLNSPKEVSMVISSLKSGVVTLIKDLNGNHVVQRCLQCFRPEDRQFIFDAAASHCVEIATHRHGCCVLQRCIDHASGPQKEQLVSEIATNSLILSLNAFGNYVVQYVLDLAMPWATQEVISRLEDNFTDLSMQKFSSNVVEKCLKFSGEENRSKIIKELIGSPKFSQLLQDPYANYVLQVALSLAEGGPSHEKIVEAIKPYLSVIRSSPFGKRILSRTNLKK